MNRHKKKLSLILALVLAVSAMSALSGCSGGKKLRLSFETFGGSNVSGLAVKKGETIDGALVPEKEDSRFIGWFYDETLTKPVAFPLVLEESLKIYAGWEGKYSISFQTYGGSRIEPITAFANEYLSAPEHPDKDGFRFGGWYEDENLTRLYEFYPGRQMPRHDLTLYAHWTTYAQITFVSGEEASEVASLRGEPDEIISAPAKPVKSGHAFVGWFTEDGDEYDFYYMPAESITLFARWRALNTGVTLEFINDGVRHAIFTQTEGSAVTVVNPAAREHFYFAGWFDSENNEYDFDGGDLMPAANTVLYARWLRKAQYARIDFVSQLSGAQADAIFVEKGSEITDELFGAIEQFAQSGGYEFEIVDAAGIPVAGQRVYSDITLEILFYRTATSGLVFEAIDESYCRLISAPNVAAINIAPFEDGRRVIEIAPAAFQNSVVQTISLPDGLRVIGDSAFENSALSGLALPSSIRSIGNAAFKNCAALATVSFAGAVSLENMGAEVFDGTPFLSANAGFGTGRIFLSGNTVLYKYANAPAIVEVTQSVKVIAGGAFAGQTNLVEVKINDSVRGIGDGAFKNCANLRNIKLPSALSRITAECFVGTLALTEITIPSTVTEIGAHAFAGSALSEIALPALLTKIGEGAFENCISLSAVNLESCIGLAELPASAFKGALSLEQVSLADSVMTIGESAFENCAALFAVDLGTTRDSKLTSIGANAFKNCSVLRRIIMRTGLNAGVSFGANALTGVQKLIVYVIDSNIVGAGMTYVQLYTGLLSGYASAVVKPFDTVAPTVTVSVQYNLDASYRVNVLDLLVGLVNGGQIKVSDNVSTELYIRLTSVWYGGEELVSASGEYDMSKDGEYTVRFMVSDEFGNAKSAVITFIADAAKIGA